MDDRRADQLWVANWAVDADGRASCADPFWRQFTGQGAAQTQDAWIDAAHPDDRARISAAWKTAFRRREPYRLEFRLRRFDGVYRRVLAAGAPRVHEDGSFQGYIGSLVDMETSRRAEETLRESDRRMRLAQDAAHAGACEADRRNDEFIAALAHELRNPLAPIHNGVHVLKAAARRRDDNADAPVLDMMERQVRQLVRLVDDLLEIARIASGKIELRKEPAALSTVLRSALAISRPFIERARHRVVLSAPHELLRVYGDPVRLSQAFSNLVSNAAKYAPPGGRIEIHVESRAPDVLVTVRDNGCGLRPETPSDVFELFAQFKSQREGGLGIGLALARKLVELHGGAIEAKSAEFVVRLPLLADDDDGAGLGASAASAPRGPKKALVVDDDHDVADTLALLLESLGATVRVAYGGEAGTREALRFDPDVVFLDLGMPGQDGFETARRIRNAENGRRKTLIALSGWGQEEDRKRSKEAGFDAHLTKPASIESLRAFLLE
ncbi:ATP-binding protein [Methylocystis sp. JAN1]|uniref:hybrid sensor histidine kinase/response regulator n=1 Tax=Methylocystis sp. JAN1 TaxID=3397211 RepID=UPI003FA2FC6C